MKRELGTCYYPEHWPEEIWANDAGRMAAAGLTWVRIGEFAWNKIEPAPGNYQWQWLDKAIQILGNAGLKVILGTPTATPPRCLRRGMVRGGASPHLRHQGPQGGAPSGAVAQSCAKRRRAWPSTTERLESGRGEQMTKRTKREVAKPYEPTPREREAAAKALEAKAAAPRMKTKMKDGNVNVWIDHADQYYGMALLMDAIGVHDSAVFDGLLSQVCNASLEKGAVNARSMNFMLGVMKGIAPKDTVEAMLAAQMAAAHTATLTFARRLSQAETIQQQDSAERAFNRMGRTFTTQVEALKKYRTGGQQKVTVEHVTVNEGGQAIVGNVETGGRGTSKKPGATS